jgi:protein-S-isoprenylcysteine O-methyltransferase
MSTGSFGLKLLVLIWAYLEILVGISRQAMRSRACVDYRTQSHLPWVLLPFALAGALLVQNIRFHPLPLPPAWLHPVGIALIVAGLVLRWSDILALSRFASANEAMHHYILRRRGCYRCIRHPAYSGLLLSLLGLGTLSGNTYSLAILLVPVTAATLVRIYMIEADLLEAFGVDFDRYRRQTKRIVPGLF